MYAEKYINSCKSIYRSDWCSFLAVFNEVYKLVDILDKNIGASEGAQV